MAISPSSTRLLGISCAIAVAFGCGGCDDNDQPPSGGTAAQTDAPSQPTTTPQKPATDEAQIKALASLVQSSFNSGDGTSLCDGLTAAGQRDMVRYGRAIGAPGVCAAVVRAIAKQNRAQGIKQETARVVAVRVRGSRAVALVRTSTVGPVQQRYVRHDGEWKIRSLRLGETVTGTKGS
jgi:hypothetical protein